MTLTIRLAAVLLVAATPAPAPAAEVDGSLYPELAAAVLLPPIVSELRRTLRDASSIRDLVMCRATKVKLKNGKPTSWSVLLSFNAKNGFGGYEGVKMYAAVFRDSRLQRIVSTQLAGNDGFSGLVNDMVARKMATCPMVAGATIEQLLGTGSSIYKEP